jgi:hypothetical protein
LLQVGRVGTGVLILHRHRDADLLELLGDDLQRRVPVGVAADRLDGELQLLPALGEDTAGALLEAGSLEHLHGLCGVVVDGWQRFVEPG